MILNNSSLHALVSAIPNKLLICIGLIGFGEGNTGPQKYLFREKKRHNGHHTCTSNFFATVTQEMWMDLGMGHAFLDAT